MKTKIISKDEIIKYKYIYNALLDSSNKDNIVNDGIIDKSIDLLLANKYNIFIENPACDLSLLSLSKDYTSIVKNRYVSESNTFKLSSLSMEECIELLELVYYNAYIQDNGLFVIMNSLATNEEVDYYKYTNLKEALREVSLDLAILNINIIDDIKR